MRRLSLYSATAMPFFSRHTLTAALRYILTGFCMGAADIVPGVSGGTMAFILGIYEPLVDSIRAVGRPPFWKAVLRFNLLEAARVIRLPFLVAVGLGILLAVHSLSHSLEYALETHPNQVWSFFFGLVLASVFLVSRRVKGWNFTLLIFVAIAAIAAYALTGLVAVDTPNDPWFLILSGAIAICAMILPGISGSFLLVLLGKYEFILSAVNDRNLLPLVYVGIGAIVGILVFAQVLAWLLRRWHDQTIAVLIGLMVGSIRVLWPWQEGVANEAGDLIQKNVLPSLSDGTTWMLIGLIVLGGLVVVLLDRLAVQKADQVTADSEEMLS